MSLTKKERENLIKTIEIASGGEISTNEVNQITGKVIGVKKLIHIAEQCYKEGVRKGLLETPIQYKLIDVLKSDYDVITMVNGVRPRDIKVVLSDMMREIACNYNKEDPFNPRFDSYIRLLLTMLVDIVELPTADAYTIIQKKWEKLFTKEKQEFCVDMNIILCTGYSRMMVVLSNDETKRSQSIEERDFRDIVEFLITIYQELHNDIIITQLTELSVDDLTWEDYKTFVKCMEGDNSPVTRAYMEEIIDVLEKEHTVGLMDTESKISCLLDCIDKYYNIPLDGFDSDINTMTTY